MLARLLTVSFLSAWLCAAGVLTHGSSPARAQTGGPPVIIVIDTQRILRESVAVKSIQSQVEKLRANYQSELKEKEQALRERDQELMRQSTILSAEVFAQKKRELEEELGAMQRQIGEKRKSFNKAYNEAMKQVQAVLIDITRDIAQGRKADLVMQRATLVYVRPDMEITEEALARLNQDLPSVALPALQN